MKEEEEKDEGDNSSFERLEQQLKGNPEGGFFSG